MSELKACPFCGETPPDESHALTDGGFKYGAVVCGCGAIGPDVRTDYKDWPHWKAAAQAEWNTRALPEGYVLVPVAQLKKIHRDLDACQKLIWANMPGCDPAYYEDAQECLAHIDAMLAAAQEAGDE